MILVHLAYRQRKLDAYDTHWATSSDWLLRRVPGCCLDSSSWQGGRRWGKTHRRQAISPTHDTLPDPPVPSCCHETLLMDLNSCCEDYRHPKESTAPHLFSQGVPWIGFPGFVVWVYISSNESSTTIQSSGAVWKSRWTSLAPRP